VAGGVVLEPFTSADFGRLITWIPDAEFLMQWGGPVFHWPLDERQLELYLAGAEGPAAERAVFRARLSNGASAETGQDSGGPTDPRADAEPADHVVGHVELNHLDPENGTATLSRVLIGPPAQRGRGHGASMVEAAVEFGFGGIGLHRIDLGVFDFNQAAIRCYERVGFRREGLLRDSRRVGDTYWDLVVMALFDDDWRASREEKR